MTVSYSRLVANGSSFGCFWSILFKWRGSVYKLVWRELLAYLAIYFSINFTYRYGLTDEQKRIFETIRQYFYKHSENIPMAFVLGFYVTLVVKRWWEQYRLLPWPDTLALFVSAAIPGVDERGRLMRRTIVRYAVLAYVITLKHVSVRVKKRFPTLQHIVDAGIMMESEKKIVEMMDERSPMAKYWMPLVWATNIINRARKESLIASDHVVQTLLMELSEHRRRLGSIISYDTVCIPLVYTQSEKKIFEMLDDRHPMAKYWLPLTWATNIINRARKDALISSDHLVQTILMEMSDIRWRLGSLIGYDNVTVPLVYTQVVTLSVYIYFLAALIGRQFVHPPDGGNLMENIDIYFPVVTVLQFCFYIGWLKVAEVLIGPFGEDDDDIELNWLIDRHIKAAYMIVDEMHEEHPELLKDQYWDEVVPRDLPYTLASECYRKAEPKGSAEFFKVKDTEALYANLTHRKSVGQPDEYADYESVDTPMVERRKNWFQRQVQRMSSVRRSSSTTYSSGLFGGTRSRHNSVYATPSEGGILPISGQYPPPPVPSNQQQPATHKISIYDRILRRKSTRRGPGKLNVNIPPIAHRNRPRIPTPDVGKEVTDKDNKLVFPHNNNNNHVGNGNVNPPTVSSTLVLTEGSQIMQKQMGEDGKIGLGTENQPSFFVLLPIAEADGNQSTITSTGSTAALAQAVLSPTLKSAGLQAVITQPVAVTTVSQPTVAITAPILPGILTTNNSNGSLKITEIPDDSGCGSSNGSPSSGEDRSRKTSTTSQRRGEVYV